MLAHAGVGREEQLLREGFLYCTSVLHSGLAALLQGALRPYDTTAAVRLMGGWRDGYGDAVQALLQRLFLYLLSSFLDLARVR